MARPQHSAQGSEHPVGYDAGVGGGPSSGRRRPIDPPPGGRAGNTSSGASTIAGQRRAQERKHRVLTRHSPSLVRGIADAVVVKEEDVFFLSPPDGSVPIDGEHGFGLYYHDCRFLNGYELRLHGLAPEPLVANAELGSMAVLELTNPDVPGPQGSLIPKEHLGIRWDRTLSGEDLVLRDRLALQNFGRVTFPVDLMLVFSAGFEDVFVVRGLLRKEGGELRPPQWGRGGLRFRHVGGDRVVRSLTIAFDPLPDVRRGTAVRFRFALDPGERKEIRVTLSVDESGRRMPDAGEASGAGSRGPRGSAQPDPGEPAGGWTVVRSDSELLDRVVARSLEDLQMLESSRESFLAAGVPWFATLFGRDSAIAAVQTLAFDPALAERTLRTLARHQGRRDDPWREEQPGKILHELRVGELARMGAIPHAPYYGTVDATPLYLILIAEHAAWTGDLRVFEELRASADLALEWVVLRGCRERDGYLEYRGRSENGLVNQGWKDSGDAVVNTDGSLASPPIALVEAQGYGYRARLSVAELLRRAGQTEAAGALVRDAEAFRSRFNRDFWLERRGHYALALQAGGRPVEVLSSNPGHGLWAGIAEPEKARRTAEAFMAPPMWTGWGVRTLSGEERAYNPIGYHLGTVWPHDNSLIAAGFRRYGLDEPARRILEGILDAATYFGHYRLPELFAGFSRDDYRVPVPYPVACHPQAWAAGSVPYLLQTALGLVPEGFDHRLRIRRPLLPSFVDRLELRGVRVAGGRADLLFARRADGSVGVDVLGLEGTLEVAVEA